MQRACPYCGNNPVPHFLYWYNETANIILTGLRQSILYNPASRFFKSRGFGQKFFLGFVGFCEALKIITRQPDIKKCKVRRAQVLWEEAEKRGIKMYELLLLGKPFDCYVAEESKIKNQKSKIAFSGLPRPSGYVNNWLDLMDDKWLFKQKMMQHGLPVPAGRSVTNFFEALEVFNNIRKPVIVKPRAGSRGRHSSTFVETTADLKKAFKIAQRLCHWVMVEEQLPGPVYRATVINFGLAGVLRGDAPQVVGNGTSSIEELVRAKNLSPHPGVKDIILNISTEIFLARQNLTFSSVPAKGQTVSLSEKIGISYGGSSSEDLEICHPDNKQVFVAAAKALGDPIVGFDFIIADITRSYKEQKSGFIEVNSLPFINLHHDPLLGRPQNVAAKLWDMMGM